MSKACMSETSMIMRGAVAAGRIAACIDAAAASRIGTAFSNAPDAAN